MKTLALETSAKSVSVAVTENGTLLAQAYQDRGLTHSVTLMPLLDGMLKTAGLTLDDMDIIAVAQGPGSFTGIRIGVSAAKGLAWAKALPCCGVSTLEAMAYGVTDFEGIVVGAMDARRQQVYNALFRTENGCVTDYARTGPWLWSWWRRNWPPCRSQSSSWATARRCCTTFCRRRGSGAGWPLPCTGSRAPRAWRWRRSILPRRG